MVSVPKAAYFDWDDRIDLERLNNWRNQTMRPVFGPKRKTGPHEYTNEEIAHLRELGEKERGLRPPGGFEALGKEFERLFGVKRAGSAIGRKYRESMKQERIPWRMRAAEVWRSGLNPQTMGRRKTSLRGLMM